MPNRTLKLGAAIYAAGHHVAAWRAPDVPADATVSLAHRIRLAQIAEQAKLDFLFIPDSVGVMEGNLDVLAHTDEWSTRLDPLLQLTALSMATKRIGLVATATTTYNQPYTLARQFGTLDILSGGRAGWNIVTTNNYLEAGNFGASELPPHAQRYRRAESFINVVKKLWDSWEDDAFVRDKVTGQFFLPGKLHLPLYADEHFQVTGPLNIPRPTQGHPVLVQAGASVAGQRLASRTSDVIFTAQPNLADAQSFYASIKEQARSHGRQPEHVLVMPGASIVVGESEADARAQLETLHDLVLPKVSLALLEARLGNVDLSGLPLDGPLPGNLNETNSGQSRQQLLIDLARREKLSIRQLARRILSASGHWEIAGTPRTIADALEHWFQERAADGFNIMTPTLPGLFERFTSQVIPELQQRKLFRQDYTGTTLRDHLGLPRPIGNSQ